MPAPVLPSHRPGPLTSSHAISRSYAAWRLKRLLIKKHGRNLHAGQADRSTEEWLHGLGLQKLSGTIPYLQAAQRPFLPAYGTQYAR